MRRRLPNTCGVFDHGLEGNSGFTGVRLSFLLSHVMQLSEKYPSAREALVKRRDEREARVRPGQGIGRM